MALYVKANRKVAEFLNLKNKRYNTNDGNYILWQADMEAFNPLYMIQETASQIGAIILQPSEARQEQDGIVLRKLPVATDDRFVIEEENTGKEYGEGTDGSNAEMITNEENDEVPETDDNLLEYGNDTSQEGNKDDDDDM